VDEELAQRRAGLGAPDQSQDRGDVDVGDRQRLKAAIVSRRHRLAEDRHAQPALRQATSRKRARTSAPMTSVAPLQLSDLGTGRLETGGAMSLELIGARETADGIAVTFVTERGIEPLEGSCDEIARLATVMQQVSALAAINENERVWIDEVAVGDAIVKLGLNPGRQGRVKIIRRS
jgi:hypothetical protein